MQPFTPSTLTTPVNSTYSTSLDSGTYTVRVTAVNEHGSSESVMSEAFVVTGVCVCVSVCVLTCISACLCMPSNLHAFCVYKVPVGPDSINSCLSVHSLVVPPTSPENMPLIIGVVVAVIADVIVALIIFFCLILCMKVVRPSK